MDGIRDEERRNVDGVRGNKRNVDVAQEEQIYGSNLDGIDKKRKKSYWNMENKYLDDGRNS